MASTLSSDSTQDHITATKKALGQTAFNSKNYSQALKTYEGIIAANSPKIVDHVSLSNAHAALGEMYFYGHGVTQSYTQALHHFNAVIAINTPKMVDPLLLSQAQNYIGQMYFDGLGVAKSYTKAVRYFNGVVATNTPHVVDPASLSAAQFPLGVMYYNGLGDLTQSYTQAFSYFNAALKNTKDTRKIPIMQYYLGLMNLTGQGTAQDTAQANIYFASAFDGLNNGLTNTHSATDKIARAVMNYFLGQMYTNGYGVTQNSATALRYYREVTPDAPWEYAHAQAIINASNFSNAAK